MASAPNSRTLHFGWACVTI